MPAVPRARRDPEGAADGEPRARPAHVVGAAESGLDSRLVEEAVRHPAGHADAGLLARLSEVVLPAPGRQRRGADSRDSRSSADVPRRAEPENQRSARREQQLESRVGRAGRHGRFLRNDQMYGINAFQTTTFDTPQRRSYSWLAISETR